MKDPDCDQVKFWADEVEEIVIKRMFELQYEKKEADEELVEYKEALAILNNQKTEIEQKLRRLYNLYADSDSEFLLETINEQEKKLADFKAQIMNEVEQTNATIEKESVANILEDLPSKWELMGPLEKQKTTRILVNRVTITGKSVKIKFNL